MVNVHEPSNSDSYTNSSGPFRLLYKRLQPSLPMTQLFMVGSVKAGPSQRISTFTPETNPQGPTTFRRTNILLFGKQPVDQVSWVRGRGGGGGDGQCDGIPLKPVNLKSQHVEVLVVPPKISQKFCLLQEGSEQKDNLPFLHESLPRRIKAFAMCPLHVSLSPLIWSRIPAYNSYARSLWSPSSRSRTSWIKSFGLFRLQQ
jgi:hypothetical protein